MENATPPCRGGSAGPPARGRSQRLHVLEIDPGSDPVSGRVLDCADRVVRELTGWLAVAEALGWLFDGAPGDAEMAAAP